MKVCSRCKQNLEDNCFNKCSANKDKLLWWCRTCSKEYGKKYGKINRKKLSKDYKQYCKKNADRIKLRSKKYHIDNKERCNKDSANWRKENPSYNSLWTKQNRERINSRDRLRRKFDIIFKLNRNLRTRLYNALKSNFKAGSAVRDLGMPIALFKLQIQAMFRDGMTWDNWGTVWHLDHIKPLASFDLTDRDQFLAAANWTNYQPLLVHENLSKGAKIL